MYIGNDLQVAESGNKIIDDISSSFNGSTTSFALLVGGAAPVPFPINTQQIYISVNGVIQEPDPTGSAGFKLLGNNIVFSSAPANGHAFFGVILSGADYVTVGTEFPAGSATAPSITFGNDNNTGLYSVTGGTVGFTSDGVQTFTMDSNGFNFPDNKKVNLGSSSDLQIYHDGSHSRIIEAGTGGLRIGSDTGIELNKGTSENMLTCTVDGAVSLFYNNTSRFQTTNTGTNVTGVHVDDGATHDGDVTFTGAAANVVWDKSVDDLIFYDNAKAAFGTSSDLTLSHDGTNSTIYNSTGLLNLQNDGDDINLYAADDITLFVQGSEPAIKCIGNDAVELYHDGTKFFETSNVGTLTTGDAVIQDAVYLSNTSTISSRLVLSSSNTSSWTGGRDLVALDLIGNGADHRTGNLSIKIKKAASDSDPTEMMRIDGTYNKIRIPDSVQLELGGSGDLELFHNATNSVIQNNTGALYIDTTVSSGEIRLTANNINANMLVATRDAGVVLYHAGSIRLSTTNAGATVNGTLTVSGTSTSTFSGNITQLLASGQSTLVVGSGNAGGAYVVLDGDSNGDASGADYSWIGHTTSGDLEIAADNPSGNGNIYLKSNGASYTAISCLEGGIVELRYQNTKKFETTNTGIKVSGVGEFRKDDTDTSYNDLSLPASVSGIYSQNISSTTGNFSALSAVAGNASAVSQSGSFIVRSHASGYSPEVYITQRDGSNSQRNAIKITNPGAVELNYGGSLQATTASSDFDIYRRVRVFADNSSGMGGHQLAMGTWDGSNHRIEGDANRPIFITSYNAAGVKLGVSGTNHAAVTADGIKFNGDTAAANGLDDYEEGTWTPANQYLTITNNNTAVYTKVGRLVTIQFDCTYAASPDDTAQVGGRIEGLPFTSGGNGFHFTPTWLNSGGAAVGDNESYNFLSYVNGSDTKIIFYSISNSCEAIRAQTAGKRVRGTVTYMTA